MFTTLKQKLQAVLTQLESATGTANATELIDAAQAATDHAFDLMRQLAAGLKLAGPGDEDAKNECRQLVAQIHAACHANRSVQSAAVAGMNWPKVLQVIQTLLPIIESLLG